MKPQIISYSECQKLAKDNKGCQVIDQIDLAYEELFDIAHPSQKDTKTKQDVTKYAATLAPDTNGWGSWVYYPWINTVVHVPPKKELRQLRTSRNRNLVTDSEQTQLYQSTILVIGMSVGSNIVEALVSQGIGHKLILVDMDIIEPSNLNRIRAPYHHVGLNKVDAIARKVWEIDPYIEVVDFNGGINANNLEVILEKHRPDVIIDEMDDLQMKVLLREQAKTRQLPVIMAADNGDNALVDIERYDTDPNLEIFAGRIPEEVLAAVKQGGIQRKDMGFLIGKYFVGADNISLRMFQSLAEVGNTLPSWPQLGGAAALSGVSLAYAAKKIILGQPLKQGRIPVSLDDTLGMPSEDADEVNQLAAFRQRLNGEG